MQINLVIINFKCDSDLRERPHWIATNASIHPFYSQVCCSVVCLFKQYHMFNIPILKAISLFSWIVQMAVLEGLSQLIRIINHGFGVTLSFSKRKSFTTHVVFNFINFRFLYRVVSIDTCFLFLAYDLKWFLFREVNYIKLWEFFIFFNFTTSLVRVLILEFTTFKF